MGATDGHSGAWAYVEGGMGSVSQAIANCARCHGASIFTNKVKYIAMTMHVDFLHSITTVGAYLVVKM